LKVYCVKVLLACFGGYDVSAAGWLAYALFYAKKINLQVSDNI
jgi:hypothetical protein